MQRYEERLAAYQAVDFDDLIVLPRSLLQRDAEVRDAWQQHAALRARSTSTRTPTRVQYELLKLLAGERGAVHRGRRRRPEHLRLARRDDRQPEAPAAPISRRLKVIALEQNYRSTGSILRAANAVIGNNPKLYEKKLWSDLGAGEPVAVVSATARCTRPSALVARIQSLRGSRCGAALGRDFAILYRANHQARVFEQALRKARDPVQGLGRAELLRPRRDQGPVRLAAPDRQPRRRPGVPARGDDAQARHRPPDAGRARRVRRPLEVEPVRGAVRRDAGRRAEPKRAIGATARVRPLRERPRVPRAHTTAAARPRRRCCSAG